MTARAHPDVFTVDVEEWFHANYEGVAADAGLTDERVEAQTDVLLGLLASAANCKATFFVLGETGRAHRAMVEKIAREGHEIASHNLTHDRIDHMDEANFGRQCRDSKNLLEDIAQQPVIGFRAPSWSVGFETTPWFWDRLADAGYRYSSSVFPFGNFLYGDSQAPRTPHLRGSIWEIPTSTIVLLGRRIPFSGGFYLRALPSPLISACARRMHREGEPVMYYIHPREMDPDQPRLRLSLQNRVIHYTGLRGTRRKLSRILLRGATTTIAAGPLLALTQRDA